MTQRRRASGEWVNLTTYRLHGDQLVPQWRIDRPSDQANRAPAGIYRPLEVADLYRQFAQLGRDALDPDEAMAPGYAQEVVNFVSRWGVPWGTADDEVPATYPSLTAIRDEARKLHLGIALCEAWPDVPRVIDRLSFPAGVKPYDWLERQFIKNLDDFVLYPVVSRGNHRRRIRYAYRFRTLLAALWLQLSEYLDPSQAATRCGFRNCGLIIPNARPNQRFCSPTCKAAEHQAMRREQEKQEKLKAAARKDKKAAKQVGKSRTPAYLIVEEKGG